MDELAANFPGVKVTRVALYQPEERDESLGSAYEDGTILLNPFWFSRDPTHLELAAKHRPITVVGDIELGWHGPMVHEPQHVLVHEFGHLVWNSLPNGVAEKWSTSRWRAATRNTSLAPTGYALANPSEFFAEMFALCELGYGTPDQIDDMNELVEPLK